MCHAPDSRAEPSLARTGSVGDLLFVTVVVFFFGGGVIDGFGFRVSGLGFREWVVGGGGGALVVGFDFEGFGFRGFMLALWVRDSDLAV